MVVGLLYLKCGEVPYNQPKSFNVQLVVARGEIALKKAILCETNPKHSTIK